MTMLHRPASRRRAALALEAAFAHLAFITLLIALVYAGYGTYRFQTVPWMACEAARYAAVHAHNYEKETGITAPTEKQIHDEVVLPLAIAMDPNKLAVKVEFIDGLSGQATAWDASDKSPSRLPDDLTNVKDVVSNKVRVTVTYQWFPEIILAGPYTLRGVSEAPIAY